MTAAKRDASKLLWFYLDPDKKEHGPFATELLRKGVDNGQITKSVLVRLSTWNKCFPVSDLYPDHSAAFVDWPKPPQEICIQMIRAAKALTSASLAFSRANEEDERERSRSPHG